MSPRNLSTRHKSQRTVALTPRSICCCVGSIDLCALARSICGLDRPVVGSWARSTCGLLGSIDLGQHSSWNVFIVELNGKYSDPNIHHPATDPGRHQIDRANQGSPRAIVLPWFPSVKKPNTKRFSISKINAFYDSQLVANQLNGEYEANNDCMDAYLKVVQDLAKEFTSFTLIKIPRNDNSYGNAFAALASTSDPNLKRLILVGSIDRPSINKPDVTMTITDGDPSSIEPNTNSSLIKSDEEPSSKDIEEVV
ncbi:unnamed protein product [Microthlaspi erraticum]|uniref:RNase H type-1 domain-containing protein n=1 Tax=Microthlaspi erraticum TaxID=1685480 RepID=A0A6D2IIW2_9BRAS|nr:unnamed protein product [Microthlaspi erraticum]